MSVQNSFNFVKDARANCPPTRITAPFCSKLAQDPLRARQVPLGPSLVMRFFAGDRGYFAHG